MNSTRLSGVPIVIPGAPAAILVESILYGAHIVLFLICIRILIGRKDSRQRILLLPITVIFLLTTVDITMSFNMMLGPPPYTADVQATIDIVRARLYPKNPLYVTNNFLADIILLYRCYMVWGQELYIIILPVALLIADTVWGYISIGTSVFFLESLFSTLYFGSVFSFNFCITAATAGRIWWVTRKTSNIFGKQTTRRYRNAVAILVESGVLYCVPLLLMLSVPHKPYKLIFQALTIRLVGIIPTWMIVQVELSRQNNESGPDWQSVVRSSNGGTNSTPSSEIPPYNQGSGLDK